MLGRRSTAEPAYGGLNRATQIALRTLWVARLTASGFADDVGRVFERRTTAEPAYGGLNRATPGFPVSCSYDRRGLWVARLTEAAPGGLRRPWLGALSML